MERAPVLLVFILGRETIVERAIVSHIFYTKINNTVFWVRAGDMDDISVSAKQGMAKLWLISMWSKFTKGYNKTKSK